MFYALHAIALILMRNVPVPLFLIVFLGVIQLPGGVVGALISPFITLIFSLHARHVDVIAAKVIQGGSG